MDDTVSRGFAQDAAAATMRDTPDDDSKAALCVGALVAGCPDAFVDFHRLATSDDGFGDDAMTAEEAFDLRIDMTAEDYVAPEELPVEYARFVRDVLVEAESSGDPTGSIPHAGKTLTQFFHDKGDHEKASYFIIKDLDRAVAAGNRKTEVLARRRLAHERETQGAFTASAAAFKNAATICEREAKRESSDAEIIGIATASDETENSDSTFSFASTGHRSSADFARVLYKSASACRARNDLPGTETALEECLAACDKAGAAADVTLEAIARHELGLSRRLLGDFPRAVELQTAYLQACEIVGDERGEGIARRARADARWEQGDCAAAENDLLQMLAPESAERYGWELRRERERKLEAQLNGDKSSLSAEDQFTLHEVELLTAEAKGWCTLGKMRSARGTMSDAALAHEKFFQLASVCGDKALEREARVCLGQARGAARLEQLMQAVVDGAKQPAERLMKWKSNGASFFQV